MNWINKLKEKWKLKSLFQVIVILIVFSCTGFTVLFIREPILNLISGDQKKEWWMYATYILCILPLYNMILLCYGFIFGQFAFFWKYEQKILRRFGIHINNNKQ